MTHDEQYLALVEDVLANGTEREDRTGTGTIAVFGRQMRFNMKDRTIPMLTTKKIHLKSIILELLWYISGSGNIKYLQENGVRIWNEWADENGDLGPVYGVQWRSWKQYKHHVHPEAKFMSPNDYSETYWPEDIDQIAQLIDGLKANPAGRRHMVNAWNVGELDLMALPPCHYSFQCDARPLTVMERVYEAGRKYHPNEILENTQDQSIEKWLDDANTPKYELSLILNQRSCDVGLGVPFNIVQYSILLHMLAQVTNMSVGEFIWNGGNVHIYKNHIEQLRGQVLRKPYDSPKLRFARNVTDIDDFKFEDFVIAGYQSHPAIKMDVAV